MTKRSISIVIIAALALLGAAGVAVLSAKRPGRRPVASEGVIAALGGFRSLAAEAIWFRAERLQEEGRYVELAQLASTLTFLESHTPEVWSYAAWNLAYNISIMMPTEEDRWRWVSAGLSLLRDEGLRLNPGEPELCCELAWLFQIKIGGKTDSAAPLYRRKWREIVEKVQNSGDWGSIGMERPLMDEVERQYGIRDWTNAQASAIYWARLGLRSATGQTKRFLEEIVSQARIIYSKEVGARPLDLARQIW